MALNAPCCDFVTRWIGGACPPAWNGPSLPIGVLGLPHWILGCVHGFRAFVWTLHAGTNALFLRKVAFGRAAGMLRPAAEVLAGPWSDSLGAFRGNQLYWTSCSVCNPFMVFFSH